MNTRDSPHRHKTPPNHTHTPIKKVKRRKKRLKNLCWFILFGWSISPSVSFCLRRIFTAGLTVLIDSLLNCQTCKKRLLFFLSFSVCFFMVDVEVEGFDLPSKTHNFPAQLVFSWTKDLGLRAMYLIFYYSRQMLTMLVIKIYKRCTIVHCIVIRVIFRNQAPLSLIHCL